MSEAMPRDSLGRIVYVGDVWEDGTRVISIQEGSSARFAETLDLAASPARTNYERYFADLGTRDEVRFAVSRECNSRSCSGCVFANWVSMAYCGSGIGFCYIPFNRWLDMKAVI